MYSVSCGDKIYPTAVQDERALFFSLGRVIGSMWSDSCFAIRLNLIILFLQLRARDLEDKSGVSESCSIPKSLDLESGVGLVVPKAVHPCRCRQLSCVSILRSSKRKAANSASSCACWVLRPVGA